jgi:hypothetical protein
VSTALACLVAFFSGALYELGCVFWVHNAEKGNAGRTAGWSMICASCTVLGIGDSVEHHVAAPFFVLGYGAGSFVGVLIAKRKARR